MHYAMHLGLGGVPSKSFENNVNDQLKIIADLQLLLACLF